MNTNDIQHRDQVLRTYFEGRSWDDNNEYQLTREFVLNSAERLPSYPFLVDYEWEVEANCSQDGKGDLLIRI